MLYPEACPKLYPLSSAKLQVPGGDSDEESRTPSASPRQGRSRPSSSVQESSSESEDGDSRGEVLDQGGGTDGRELLQQVSLFLCGGL